MYFNVYAIKQLQIIVKLTKFVSCGIWTTTFSRS